MAQIIKHRRGSILSLKDVSANIGELVVGTGSIDNLSGPVLFVGHTAVNGGYNPVSKIYQGTNAPSISVGSHGSTMDGVPFYSTATQTLFILDKSGNIGMDLTGNIEGNSINSVTISTISGSTSVIGDVNVTNNLSVTGTTLISGATTIDDTLRVTGNSSLEGNLSVTGDTTFNDSVTITGLTDNRLVIVGTGGLLEDSTNLTFDGTTFNIGQGQFEVDNSTGNIRTSGSITMKGNITIGDNQGGDIIDFNGEVSSSIIPSGSNLFNLGSPTNGWKDLYVSGTAYIESINIGSVSLNSLALPGDLTVSGTTILSGSVLVEGLTDNRIVIVGTSGLLEDDANFTFDGTELNIGTGNFRVQQSSGDVYTAGTLDVGGNTTLEGSLTVTGATELKSTLVVSGATTIDDTLKFTGN